MLVRGPDASGVKGGSHRALSPELAKHDKLADKVRQSKPAYKAKVAERKRVRRTEGNLSAKESQYKRKWRAKKRAEKAAA